MNDHDTLASAEALPSSIWMQVADHGPDLTLVVDEESRCWFASHAVTKVSGFTNDQLVGRRMLDLVHPDERSVLLTAVTTTDETRWAKGALSLTLRVCFAELAWHDVNLRVRRIDQGGRSWFLLIVRDETVQRRVEAALLRKTELELLLERIQGRFLNTLPTEIDDAIDWGLEEMGRFLGADRAYLLSYDLAARCESMTHEWCSESVDPELAEYQKVSFDGVPSCMVRSLRGEVVAVSSLDALGDEWAADRAFLEAEGIQSLLELPVVLDGKTAGSVGFDWIVDSATWTDEDLTILGVFGSTFSQILARKRSEQVLERTLADSQTRFAALVDNLPDPVMRVGSHGELLYANSAARRTLLQASDGHLRTVEDALGSLSDSFALAFETNEIQTVPLDMDTPAGHLHLETRVVPEPGPSGRPRSLLLVSSDLTERRRAEEHLTHSATHDPLTGLANRALFLSRLQAASEQFASDGPFAVLYLDLDRFKSVNDSFGHGAGDSLLLEVSRRLSSALRHGDVLARLGGDEFTVLLPDAVDAVHALDCAQRLLDAVAEPVEVAGHRLVVTGSVGVAIATDEHHDALELLHRADAAMYQAKAAGRACVVRFDRASEPGPSLRLAN